MKSFGLDGRDAERVLDEIGVATNKQVIPDDPNPPMRPSGVRLGTPACTSRGMREEHMRLVATLIADALATPHTPHDTQRLTELRAAVKALAQRFPVPGIA